MEGRLGKRSARLPVASEPETEAAQRRKRVRWAGDIQPELGTPQGSVADRPTDAERAAARSVIEAMRRAAVEPKILKNNAPADPVVVACALAIHFGQKFDSDSAAKEQFDIPRTTNVKVRWVDGKLAQLAAADPDALAAVASTFTPAVEPPSPTRPTEDDADDDAEEPPVEELPPVEGSAAPPDEPTLSQMIDAHVATNSASRDSVYSVVFSDIVTSFSSCCAARVAASTSSRHAFSGSISS